MDFGLIFFASDEAREDRYRLVLESARFADRHGFSSLWVPERHFTHEGHLYPNPAVLHGALARETTRIELRAGSVVMPLHDPLRVAEEWAMVDNLSGGRVAISFASGWHPTDFVFFPERYAGRRESMEQGIDTVRRLWRGEAVTLTGGDGRPVEVRTYPRPVRPELPVWLTAASDPQTFAKAGALGFNLLTHMFNQGIEELAPKVDLYRRSRAEHGHDPAAGRVAVMLHTFVGEDAESVRRLAHDPFVAYLGSASYLINAVARSRGREADFSSLDPEERRSYMQFVFERLIESERILFGTPDTCADFVRRVEEIGVDEIACQVDFGVETDVVLANLEHLDRLRQRSTGPVRRREAGAVSSTPPHHEAALRPAPPQEDSLGSIRERCAEVLEADALYAGLAARGLYGDPQLLPVRRVHRRDGEALVRVEITEPGVADSGESNLLVDACFLAVAAALPSSADGTWQPDGFRRLRIDGSASAVWVHAVLGKQELSAGLAVADVRVVDDAMRPVLSAGEVRLRRSHPAGPGAGSRQGIEGQIAGQIARVLKVPVERIDPSQPLNRIGLDSLMAVELKNSLATRLGISVPIASLLRGATLRDLARMLGDGGSASPEPAASPEPDRGASPEPGTPYPLSVNQQGLWVHHRMTEGDISGNVMMAWRVVSPLDMDALRRALGALVDRHPMLRSTYSEVDGEPFQRIQPSRGAAFEVLEASGWTEERLHREIGDAAHRSFDLERGPLLRVDFFNRPGEGGILLLVAHHMISDLWSFTLLFDDLGALYQVAKAGLPAPPSPAGATYRDYVAWQAEMLAGSEGEHLWRYWRRQLAGADFNLDLAVARPRPAQPTDRGGLHAFCLDEVLSRQLRGLAGSRGVTLFTLLLGAFQVLLHRCSGAEDIVVVAPTVSRGRPELAGIFGYFTNLVALRGDLSGDPTFLELLGRLNEVVLGAMEHDAYPFPLLLEKLGARRDRGQIFLPVATFDLHRFNRLELDRTFTGEAGPAASLLAPSGAPVRIDLGDLVLESFPLEPRFTRHEIFLQMVDAGGVLSGSFQYALDRYDPSVIERLEARFKVLLAEIAADPSRSLARFAAGLAAAGEEGERRREDRERSEIGRLQRLRRRRADERTPEAAGVAKTEELW